MSDQPVSAADKASLIGVIAAIWLLIPFPIWLVGVGFAGSVVFWPSFGVDAGEALITTIWLFLFYGPILLLVGWLGRIVWKRLRHSKSDAFRA